MMSLFVVSAVFIRWLPYYGLWILTLIVLAGLTGLGIYTSQRRRYRRQSSGIADGRIHADAAAALGTAAGVVALGALGIVVVAT